VALLAVVKDLDGSSDAGARPTFGFLARLARPREIGPVDLGPDHPVHYSGTRPFLAASGGWAGGGRER
jgi:hypothetical protein